MTEWSLTQLRQLQTWFCNCLLKINSQPSPRSLWRSKPLYVEIYLVMISPHISIIQWWKLTRVLQFPIFKVIEPKDIHDFKKRKENVLCKRCGFTFNQISCVSFIHRLMEIMSHLTSTSTPTKIWRASRGELHFGVCRSSVRSPSDVKMKCVKGDGLTAPCPTRAAHTGQQVRRGGPFSRRTFLIMLCSFN